MPGRIADATLLAGNDASVRVVTLQAGEVSPWHYHTNLVSEHVVALDPGLTLEQRRPDEMLELAPGAIVKVRCQAPHRLVNQGALSARYLLIQRGSYDFIRC